MEPAVEGDRQALAVGEGLRLVVEVGLPQDGVVRLWKGADPGCHLPGHAAQRVEVGPGPVVAPAPVELLGGHVARGSAGAPVALAQGVAGVGEAEVRELQPRSGVIWTRDEHVARLQIPVDDAAGVGVGQRVQQIQERALEIRPRPDEVAGRHAAAAGQLHHEVGAARQHAPAAEPLGLQRDLAVVEDQHDAWVIEASDGAHLVAEGGQVGRASGQGVRDHLDRDGHALLGVHTSPHLPHTANCQG